MKNKLLGFSLKYLLPLGFWLGIWQIMSFFVSNSFLLPGIPETASELVGLFSSKGFYLAVLLSTIRVIIGLLLGILLGFLLALLCRRSKIFSSLILPLISIIKSTPVASFIVVLWVLLSGDGLSIFIGFLMVMPIILQNTLDGYNAIDKGLSEVADIFEFSTSKRFKLLIFPTLKSYLAPAIITASGLCWKAEIAAEIIAYTKRSIGQGINDAKYEMNTAKVFAWTVVIITFSILLERVTKRILGRAKKCA